MLRLSARGRSAKESPSPSNTASSCSELTEIGANVDKLIGISPDSIQRHMHETLQEHRVRSSTRGGAAERSCVVALRSPRRNRSGLGRFRLEAHRQRSSMMHDGCPQSLQLRAQHLLYFNLSRLGVKVLMRSHACHAFEQSPLAGSYLSRTASFARAPSSVCCEWPH